MLTARTAKAFLLLALIAVFAYDDARLFGRPRENWKAAANVVDRLSASGACLLFAPADSINLYLVFDQDLSSRQCDVNQLESESRIAIAISPYAPPNALNQMLKMLPKSFAKSSRMDFGGPIVAVYRRKTY